MTLVKPRSSHDLFCTGKPSNNQLPHWGVTLLTSVHIFPSGDINDLGGALSGFVVASGAWGRCGRGKQADMKQSRVLYVDAHNVLKMWSAFCGVNVPRNYVSRL